MQCMWMHIRPDTYILYAYRIRFYMCIESVSHALQCNSMHVKFHMHCVALQCMCIAMQRNAMQCMWNWFFEKVYLSHTAPLLAMQCMSNCKCNACEIDSLRKCTFRTLLCPTLPHFLKNQNFSKISLLLYWHRKITMELIVESLLHWHAAPRPPLPAARCHARYSQKSVRCCIYCAKSLWNWLLRICTSRFLHRPPQV